MRNTSFLLLTASMGAALACSHRVATPDTSAHRGAWGSNQASVTIGDTSATLQFLASGGCFGAHGEIDLPIPNGPFDLTGVYTQLMGAYPGHVTYAAQYSGAVSGNEMSITATVPGLGQTFGPFSLTYGVKKTWVACMYP
jgi:hypothetical protein